MERDDAFRLLFKSGAVIYVGTIFELGASFLAKVLMAKYLGRFDYGTVTIGLTFLTFTSGILILGLNTGVSRFVPRFESEDRQWTTVFIGYVLALPLPLLVAAITILNPDWIAVTVFRAPNAGPVLRIFAVGIPFAVFVSLSKGAIRGFQRSTPRVAIDNAVIPFSRLLLVAALLFAGASAVEMSLAYVVPWLLGSVVAAYFLRDGITKIHRILGEVEFEWVSSHSKELIVFSAPLVLTAITGQILNDLDVFILSFFKENDAVGVYTVVYPLAKLISVPLTAFGYIVLPILSEQHSDGQHEEMKAIYQMGTKWVVFAALPVVFAFAVYPAGSISLTFGAEFAEGATALVVLAVGFLLVSLAGFNSSTLTSVGETRFIAVTNLLGAACNVGLNLYLIPQYSYVGAAAATVVSVLVINVLMCWRLFREYDIQPVSWRLVRPLLAAVPLVGVLHYLVYAFGPVTAPTFVGVVVLSGLVYLAAILRLGGFGEDELMIIESIEERFDVDLRLLKRVVPYERK